MIPDIAAFVVGDTAISFTIVHSATTTVACRPGLFEIVIGITTHAPAVAVHAYLCIYIKIIQQYEFMSDRMLIRRHPITKQHEAGITIPLPDIPEPLVISTVLLDDIEHILYRRGI